MIIKFCNSENIIRNYRFEATDVLLTYKLCFLATNELIAKVSGQIVPPNSKEHWKTRREPSPNLNSFCICMHVAGEAEVEVTATI